MSRDPQLKAFSRYIPESEDARRWGIVVTDLGYTRIPAGTAYPPGQHPAAYQISPVAGRILSEYQIVFISEGAGTFWSETSGKISLTAGSAFLLFPHIRHRYEPLPQTGWNESWIGFSGDQADRLINEFFDPKHPVIQVGTNSNLSDLFANACDLARHEAFGFRPIIAAKTMEVLAHVHSLSLGETLRSPRNEDLLRKACSLLHESLRHKFDFVIYAQQQGLSYSSFRRLFKDHTGLPPHQYLLELRIRKARSLLTTTTLSVESIADEVGFDSSFYFSRCFKQRTGLAPRNFRKKFR
jgi:AraC-like DNA-binding protein